MRRSEADWWNGCEWLGGRGSWGKTPRPWWHWSPSTIGPCLKRSEAERLHAVAVETESVSASVCWLSSSIAKTLHCLLSSHKTTHMISSWNQQKLSDIWFVTFKSTNNKTFKRPRTLLVHRLLLHSSTGQLDRRVLTAGCRAGNQSYTVLYLASGGRCVNDSGAGLLFTSEWIAKMILILW